MSHIIYALIDPRDQREFYIGRTEDLYRRFSQHLKCTDKNDAKNTRVLELKALHLVPILKTLEIIEDAANAATREAYWIRHFRMLGYQLTNDIVYSSHEAEDNSTSPVSNIRQTPGRRKTGVARRVYKIVKHNPTITALQLSEKLNISRSYAGKLKAFVLDNPEPA